MSSRKFVRTGTQLRQLIKETLEITQTEFASYCGRSDHVWVSQQIARKTLTFEARSRAFLGLLNYRYEETLDRLDGLSEEAQNALKAVMLDQMMRMCDDVLLDQGVARLHKIQK